MRFAAAHMTLVALNIHCNINFTFEDNCIIFNSIKFPMVQDFSVKLNMVLSLLCSHCVDACALAAIHYYSRNST